MKLLKASVLILSLMLVACEGAVSPTEPQLIESQEVRALPDAAGPMLSAPEVNTVGKDTIQDRY
ncbi:MAG: hypothetical protein WBO69_19180 [Thermoanaerobaculia bacterium]